MINLKKAVKLEIKKAYDKEDFTMVNLLKYAFKDNPKTYRVKPRFLNDYKKTPLQITTKDKSQINLLKKTFKFYYLIHYSKSTKIYTFTINYYKVNLNGV